MKKQIWIPILIVIIIIVVGVVIMAGNKQKPLEGEVKVGIISALTGGASSFGIPALNATKLAVDEINNNGGINGKKLVLISEDGQCNAKHASDAANKLINIDKVPVVLTNCSTETLSVAALADPKKIITFGAISTSPAISNAGDYVFRISPKDTKGTQLLSDYMLKNGYSRIALLTANDAYSISVKKDFENYFKSNGGIIKLSENFDPGNTDFRTELMKIKKMNVQALMFIPIKTLNAVEILKQIKETDLGLPLFSTRTLVNSDAISQVGNLMNGIIYAEVKFDSTNKGVQNFLKKYIEKFGHKPTYSLQMIAGVYDRMNIVADAFRECGKDTNCLKDYFYKIKGYKGISGKITIDKNGDPDMNFQLMTVKNKEIIPLTY